jgi:hypothetical protein
MRISSCCLKEKQECYSNALAGPCEFQRWSFTAHCGACGIRTGKVNSLKFLVRTCGMARSIDNNQAIRLGPINVISLHLQFVPVYYTKLIVSFNLYEPLIRIPLCETQSLLADYWPNVRIPVDREERYTLVN